MVQYNEKENSLTITWNGANYSDLYLLQWDLLDLLKMQTETNFTEQYRKRNGWSTYFTAFDFLQKTLIDVSELKD